MKRGSLKTKVVSDCSRETNEDTLQVNRFPLLLNKGAVFPLICMVFTQDWDDDEVLDSIRNLFVTGEWDDDRDAAKVFHSLLRPTYFFNW